MTENSAFFFDYTDAFTAARCRVGWEMPADPAQQQELMRILYKYAVADWDNILWGCQFKRTNYQMTLASGRNLLLPAVDNEGTDGTRVMAYATSGKNDNSGPGDYNYIEWRGGKIARLGRIDEEGSNIAVEDLDERIRVHQLFLAQSDGETLRLPGVNPARIAAPSGPS